MEKLNMFTKNKMNKKGLAQMLILLIVIGALLVLFLGLGGVAGFVLKKTISKIPVIVWIGLALFILFMLGGKKK